MTRLAVLGFGLIGGSIARALAERSGADRWSVAAWSPSGRGPAEAHRLGVVDTAATDLATAMAEADLVILAAPPLACLDLLDRLAGRDRAALAPDAVVTDVASSKAAIAARAATLDLRFVGGHPMAGSERSGFGAALADLFVDRPWVVTTPAPDDAEAVGLVERLAVGCGAVPLQMTPEAHDQAVAAISHLPLLVAVALGEAVTAAPDWSAVARLAAGGWRDMTRLARGDVEMSAGIAVTNAAALAERARALRAVLDDWITELEAEPEPNADRLRERFAALRDRLTAS